MLSRATKANLAVLPIPLEGQSCCGDEPRISPNQVLKVMRVTVERAALLKALGHVHRVVERRNTIPILSNVLLRADEGSLRLKATDLDIEVTETIPPTSRRQARPPFRPI